VLNTFEHEFCILVEHG